MTWTMYEMVQSIFQGTGLRLTDKIQLADTIQLAERFQLAQELQINFNIHINGSEPSHRRPTLTISDLQKPASYTLIKALDGIKSDSEAEIPEESASVQVDMLPFKIVPHIVLDDTAFWEKNQIHAFGKNLRLVPLFSGQRRTVHTLEPQPRMFDVVINGNQCSLEIWTGSNSEKMRITYKPKAIDRAGSLWKVQRLRHSPWFVPELPNFAVSFDASLIDFAVLITREHRFLNTEYYVFLTKAG